jgi:cytochrome c oxidase cbb3-type subunit 3
MTLVVGVCVAALWGCLPEKRQLGPHPPITPPTGLGDSRSHQYETNRYENSEGSRLFRWLGCDRCHSDPAPGYLDLADTEWRQGGATAQIYRSIATGTTGMPGYSQRLSPQQIWQIAGYLHGLNVLKPEQRRRNADALQGEPSGDVWRGALP